GHDSLGQGIACDRLTGKDGAEPVPDCRPMLPTSSPLPAQPALIDRLQAGYRSLLLRLLLAALSGLMLCVPWLNNQLIWRGWLGWVPLRYALRGAGPGMGLLLGWVAGTLCFAGGSYWLAQFMINLQQVNPGLSLVLAALFWSYLGLNLGLTSMLYRWLVRRLG